MADLVPRAAAARLSELTAHLRVVMVSGPRQSGKTTLLREHLHSGGTFRSLDRPETLSAARDDPATFATSGPVPRIIDEVQLGGDQLVRAIKADVDAHPEPGRVVLSGSSRSLTIPTLSESLAGRVAFVELWPLSMAERTRSAPDAVTRWFGDVAAVMSDSAWTRPGYLAAVTAGGYPGALTITSALARRAWFDGYLSTVITRDIRDFATVTRGDTVATLLGLVAARAGGIACSPISRTRRTSPATPRGTTCRTSTWCT
ncbi:ATP-binding protein [Jiangella sp. DSM 45060]|uniref:ATP-binding protein n=1 Tax=Jiangella sp. DSM 45060 TaxID=1798224 RepID=UPI000B0F2B98|nr:AAA family ATPase [Jiangella sp. DSM 45060]